MTTTTENVSPLATVMAWLADQTWSDFAQSLSSQYARKGTLSPKQEAAARRMFAKAAGRTAPAAAPVATVDPPHGLHVVGTDIIRVKMTRGSRQLVAMRLVTDGHGDWQWDYLGKRGLRGLSAETAMTAAQATAWGQAHLRCVNCFAELTDKRSEAMGYGAICAGHHGWHYPTMAEAEDILAERERAGEAEA